MPVHVRCVSSCLHVYVYIYIDVHKIVFEFVRFCVC